MVFWFKKCDFFTKYIIDSQAWTEHNSGFLIPHLLFYMVLIPFYSSFMGIPLIHKKAQIVNFLTIWAFLLTRFNLTK